MNKIYINGCGDCPFQNTDAEVCNATDAKIPVWSPENDRHPPEQCPLWGGGVLVVVQEE